MEKVQRLFREKWGKVTDADWYKIAGKRDQLIGHIQERYGMAREQAQKEGEFACTMPSEAWPAEADRSADTGQARRAGQH